MEFNSDAFASLLCPSMNIRHLLYFVTLAREKHHRRAAEACNVSQPTLTGGVAQLERELGVPLIVRNGQRFGGLTAEGERALQWAQRIISDQDALQQDIATMREGLTGVLRLAIIPAATPVAPLFTASFLKRYPGVSLRLLSHTSVEIERGLEAGELDAGVTYLDNEPLSNVRSHLLYRERYMLLTPRGGPFDNRASITWREAATLPLCLLTRDMQNRRIIDGLFAAAKAEPQVTIEMNGVLPLIAYVQAGGHSSVVPHAFLTLLGGPDSALDGLVAIPLVDPQASYSLGLVVPDREPLPALTRAFLDEVTALDIQAELDRRHPQAPH
jgi:DNA-binding transcriptional LysR family regulator